MTGARRLPGVGCAQVEHGKVIDYLLATAHPDGGPKARFFLARGARAEAWEVFAKTLVEHARLNPVARVRDDRACQHSRWLVSRVWPYRMRLNSASTCFWCFASLKTPG